MARMLPAMRPGARGGVDGARSAREKPGVSTEIILLIALLAGIAVLLLRPRRHIRIDQLYRIAPQDLWDIVVPSPHRPNLFESIERYEWAPGSGTDALVVYRHGLKARLTQRPDHGNGRVEQVMDLLDGDGRSVERLTCQVALVAEPAGTRLVMDIFFQRLATGGPLHWLTTLFRPMTARSLRLQIEQVMEASGARARFEAAHGEAPAPRSVLGMRLSRGALALAVIAAAWWTWEFGPWLTLALMVGLVAHETGHVAVMRAFRDRTSAFYFIPFLGGVAVGRMRHGQDWQHAAMVLGGPAAGLASALAAALLGWLTGSDYLLACAFFFAALNLFNLVPLPPLDGGQLLILALRPFLPARVVPHVSTALLAMSCAVLLWFGWWLLGALVGGLVAIALVQPAARRMPDRPALTRGQALSLAGISLALAGVLWGMMQALADGSRVRFLFRALVEGPFGA
jgi:Zn-dependent protease